MRKKIISVAVVTYNSSATVLETLDSIMLQTYGSENIDLVISDDASIDSTIDLIEKWVDINGSKFNSIEVIINPMNRGVSANCNVAWKASETEWIKTIAGDDILLPDCLSEFESFVSKNDNVDICFCELQPFDKSGSEYRTFPFEYYKVNYKLPQRQQFVRFLSSKGFIHAPGSFIKTSLLKEVNYADENYRNMEDLPLWFKILKTGRKIYLLEKVLVNYRLGDSVSRVENKLFNINHIDESEKFYKEVIYPELNKISVIYRIREEFNFKMKRAVVLLGNKKGLISNIILTLSSVMYPRTFLIAGYLKIKRIVLTIN